MRQIIALWFPTFSTDRVCRTRRALPFSQTGIDAKADPVVTYQAVNGRLFVDAVGAGAASGVFPGQALSEARLAVSGLRAIEADPAADRRLLADLADWCGRYAPVCAPEDIVHGQAGIWLDMTDGGHLAGGQAATLATLLSRMRGFGFTVRAALAPTPGAAWAFARHDAGAADGLIVTPLELRARLRHLPIAALRLPRPLVEEAGRVGLTRIGDLYEFARAGLVAHFGPVLVRRLDQALGRVVESVMPARPVAAHRVQLACAVPIATVEAAGSALRSLLGDLASLLDARSLGARRLELAVYRVDGAVRRLPMEIEPALSDPVELFRLMAAHLDKLGLDAGVETMVLSASLVEARPGAALELGDSVTPRLSGVRADGRAMARPSHAAARHAALSDRRIPRVAPSPARTLAEPASLLSASAGPLQ